MVTNLLLVYLEGILEGGAPLAAMVYLTLEGIRGEVLKIKAWN